MSKILVVAVILMMKFSGGGTIVQHADSGDQVEVLIVAEGPTSRQQNDRPKLDNCHHLLILQIAGSILALWFWRSSIFQITVWIS